MKLLTGLRLINWHYFQDETIEFNGSTLITGDSGSGKSTILDAIQYVLVGDQRLVRFNSAAHDTSGRTLRTYLRGKTGQSDDSSEALYLRAGDFTSYVVLEFSDTRTRVPFLIGVAVDSYSTGDQSDSCFFKAESTALRDFALAEGRVVLNLSKLRERARQNSNLTLYPTIERYHRDLLHKLGYLAPHFFRVLTKAMGFRPIDNMRKFVYNYLLDSDPVRLDVMRETMWQYRRFEELVAATKKKIESLTRIEDSHKETETLRRRINIQEYIIRRAKAEEAAARVTDLRNQAKRCREEAVAAQSRWKSLDAHRAKAETQRQDLMRQIYSNPTHQRLERLAKEISALEANLANRKAALESWRSACRQETDSLQRVAAGFAPLDMANEDREATLVALETVAQAIRVFSSNQEAASAATPAFLEQVAMSLRVLNRAAEHLSRMIASEKSALMQMGAQAVDRLNALSKNKLTYDHAVEKLIELIRSQVVVEGKPVLPVVLCELLEVLDPRWQNAIEGYLNTQRFDLIVPDSAFDLSLSVYEKSRREQGIHGVGLIDGQKQRRDAARPEPNSLAHEVKTSHPVARAYIDRLLGSVIKCSSEQELRRYRTSITQTCMTYRNGVARRINPEVYRTPYIGRRAIELQIKQVSAQIQEISAKVKDIDTRASIITKLLGDLGDRELRYARLADNLALASEIPSVEQDLKQLRKELREVDLAEVDRLQSRAKKLETDISAYTEQITKAHEDEAVAENNAVNADAAAHLSQADHAKALTLVEEHASAIPSLLTEAISRFEEEARDRPPGKIAESFETNILGNKTRLENALTELVQLRTAYNNQHQFGGDERSESNKAYTEELLKLRQSELPEYEEKIAKARESAELEFKDHFVSKLKERIDGAQASFSLLNRKLRDIEFGQERYHFEVRPHPELRQYYEMITDDVLLEGGQSLFSDAYQAKHSHAIKDFFDRLLQPEPGSREQELERLVDYRSYLDFDIRVQSGSQSTKFSHVATQRSGGESQTPYYVAIAASFLQLYRGSNSDDSVQLMLFDEAFDKMDGDRIRKTLLFIRELGLQLIAAAPPERIEWISPHVDTTVLVVREGQWVTVTDYQQELEMLDDDEAAAAKVGGAATER